MENALAGLVAANVAFVGSHFAMSHPLRAPMVRVLGEKGFLGVYSLVSLGFFAWIVLAFRATGEALGRPVLWDAGDAGWLIASLLTAVATALVLGANGKGKGGSNPAMVGMGEAAAAAARPVGALAVTRHPMMWGVAIWALAHVIAWPSPRTLVTAMAMAVLALVGAHLQDGKKEALLGDAWKGWQAQTSFLPRLTRLGSIGIGTWAAAIVLWLGFTWAHGWLGVPAAGLWRWIG